MAGYGVVGGALLGTASLAFGSGGRSIAKGASLGLYAGLIFGGYVILSYEMKKRGFGAEQQQPDLLPRQQKSIRRSIFCNRSRINRIFTGEFGK